MNKVKPFLIVVLLLISTVCNTQAKAYTVYRDSSSTKRIWLKNLWVPTALIGTGLLIYGDNGLYSSQDIRNDIQYNWPDFHTKADEYLQYAPGVFVYGADLCGLRPKTDFWNRSAILAKAELMMMVSVYGLKYTVQQDRPNGEDDHSFPSGHTAQAFLLATFMHKEFGERSIWYSVGAYTCATSVGVMALLNDRHWASYVLVGAGLGVLSVNIAYLTHKYKWNKHKSFSMSPVFYGRGGMGLSVGWKL